MKKKKFSFGKKKKRKESLFSRTKKRAKKAFPNSSSVQNQIKKEKISFLLYSSFKATLKSNKRLQSQFPSQDNQSKR